MDTKEYYAGHRIALQGTIGGEMLDSFEKQITDYFKLNEEDRKPIVVTISSHGGSTGVSIVIYEQLRLLAQTVEVSAVALGRCMSAAVTIFLALSLEQRFTTTNTLFLLHQQRNGTIKIAGASESIRDLQIEQALFDRTLARHDYDWVLRLLARETGKKKKEIKKLCDPGALFTAKEAQRIGLVSSTIT